MPSDGEQRKPDKMGSAEPCQFCGTLTDNGCTVGVFTACNEHWDNPDAALASLRERLAASLAREARLRDALPDPAKLWSLAEWLEMQYPGDPNPEIQDDLRAWAKTIYATDPAKYGTYWVQAICDEEARAAAAPAAGGQPRDG